jgi:hypothetical protein
MVWLDFGEGTGGLSREVIGDEQSRRFAARPRKSSHRLPVRRTLSVGYPGEEILMVLKYALIFLCQEDHALPEPVFFFFRWGSFTMIHLPLEKLIKNFNWLWI